MKSFLKNILQQFNKNLEEIIHSNANSKRFLIGVSGGSDSMALLEMFHLSGLDFAVAHCNFTLRGNDSDLDEELVINYCKNNSIEYYRNSFATKDLSIRNHTSIQETARMLRYQWFEELCQTNGFEYIVTAHHLDDHIETFFLNLVRGSGPKGLRGIPLKNKNIIRPLLTFEKSVLEQFCNINKVPYILDISNQDNKYRRNYIRNIILPSFYGEFPGLKSNLTRVMSIQSVYYSFVETKVDLYLKQNVHRNNYGFKLDLTKVKDLDLTPFIIKSWMKQYGFSISDAEDMVLCIKENKSGAKFYTQHSMAVSDRQCILILDKDIDLGSISIVICNTNLQYGNYKISIKSSDSLPLDNEVKISLGFEGQLLSIRAKQDGDKIKSKGMHGQKQKLQDIYTNAKLDYLQKKTQPVVVLGKDILWIPGIKKSMDTIDTNEEGWIIGIE